MSAHLGRNFLSIPALLRFAGVCAAGIALDLGSKIWAFDSLLRAPVVLLPGARAEVDSNVYRLIPGWVHFEVTVNQGAVFGIGQGQRWLFVCVSLAAIGFLSFLFAHSERRQWVYQILLGMLLAGVLGNLYDRIVFGYVRDMIHALPRWPALFPYIFNVADMLLCVGVFLMVVYSFFHHPPASAHQHKADASSAR